MEIKIKEVAGYEGLYIACSNGRIYSQKSKRFLKPYMRGNYLTVELSKNNCTKKFYVHRIIATAFLKKPKGENIVVNHKDENKLNNNLENLEWVTTRENNLYSINRRKKEKQEKEDKQNKEIIVNINVYINK